MDKSIEVGNNIGFQTHNSFADKFADNLFFLCDVMIIPFGKMAVVVFALVLEIVLYFRDETISPSKTRIFENICPFE